MTFYIPHPADVPGDAVAYRPREGDMRASCQLHDQHVCWTETLGLPNIPPPFLPPGCTTLTCPPIDPPIAPAIPEPATWAMLIAGFALVGVVARRKMVRTAATEKGE